jgi:hypothetical protein
MRKLFPGVNLAVHAGQLFDELMELGLDSLTKVADEVLGEVPSPGIDTQNVIEGARRELEDFGAWLRAQGETRYELEPDSSDLLLVQLLACRAADIVAMHPVGRGVGGPSRVAWFAKRHLTFFKTHVIISS